MTMLIGEVSRRSGVSTRMLRHYDRLGLVTPTARTPGGYRDYSPTDISRLFQVQGLRSLGLSLKAIRDLVTDSSNPAPLIDDLLAQAQQRLAREQELIDLLKRIEHTTPTDWEDVLRTVQLLAALDSGSPTIRHRAALSAPGPGAAPEAIAAALLAESDTNVAGALAWALAAIDDGAAIAALAAGARSPDAAVRRRVVTVAATLTGPDAARLLRDGLADDDRTVRAAAMLALADQDGHGDSRDDVVAGLIEMVCTGIRDVEAAERLRVIGVDAGRVDDVAADLGRRLVDSATPSAARSRLAQALVELGHTAAVDQLRQVLDDRDPAVAAIAKATVPRSPRHSHGNMSSETRPTEEQ